MESRHPKEVIQLPSDPETRIMVFMASQPSTNRTSLLDLLRSPHVATVFVILLAYLLAYIQYVIQANSPAGADYSITNLLLGTLLGVVYLYLLIQDDLIIESAPTAYTKEIHFIILTGIMIAIQFLMAGSNGIWLIAMPLIAMATVELHTGARWLVYLTTLIGLTVPFYLATRSATAVYSAALTFSPAIVFVAVFARLTERAELAQAEAEALTHQLEEANEQLSAYAVQAEELAATQERNRLAREIHDNLGHYLTVVNVQLKAALAVMDSDPAAARTTLTKARQQTEDGLTAIRQSVSALRESPLGDQTLSDAINELVEEAQSSGLFVSYRVEGSPRRLSPPQELTLFRTAQEAFTNVRRHSAASRVDIVLSYHDPSVVRLAIRDNGVGVDMAKHKVGFGLIGLRERVHQLDGLLSYSGQPGKGFSIEVTLPASSQELAVTPAGLPAETDND